MRSRPISIRKCIRPAKISAGFFFCAAVYGMMEPAVGQDGAYAPRGGMGKSAFGHSKNVNETRPAPPAGKESRHEKRTVGVRAGFSRRGYAYYSQRRCVRLPLKAGAARYRANRATGGSRSTGGVISVLIAGKERARFLRKDDCIDNTARRYGTGSRARAAGFGGHRRL